ncbi:class I SAM-dependent DNA methyltransferase [Alsobacter soli]|uniref:site-specific DNA-methyltransferase (adenine-specific) n=1 Tax=Alsobacter soli TaxID=2109933 RepID=A0A2T1HR26_9HYPH|nr:class I SAM-dependent DNA methyltransferase [Alsobacter soli]
MSGVDGFIAKWTAGEGGAERANYALFLIELCEVIGAPRPEPASHGRSNDYAFERGVHRRASDDVQSVLRIDLYKKGCFILEAKQSRLPGKDKAIAGQQSLPGFDGPAALGRRPVHRNWDVMMVNARRQAEDYVFCLEPDQPAPPFIIVCDVGHCLELYADFSGTGRAYAQFPDRQRFRIYLEDLRDAQVRDTLRKVWTDPASLNPARETARVTRAIADRLAAVSKALERQHPPEEVAHFLMRCIFTMFAEDVDLLPRGEFTALIADCLERPQSFAPLLQELWARMDAKEHANRFFSAFKQHLRHFNGNLFRQAKAFPLGREEIGELLAAAKSDWTQVDPAIFGTLLEQALDPEERSRLGAHYTPRAYVQRLVQVTVMEPLNADWRAALMRVQAAMEAGAREDAIRFCREFHRRLCETTVLDPACGTGNFLYVALELMKVLEGEVLEKIAELGGVEDLLQNVDPHQFLGLELNPRAAAIAELVVWIGYLQQHYRTRTGHPSEPILRAFDNINGGRRAGFDAVATWDGYPALARAADGKLAAPAPRRPSWPEADFIVGNPPFIGGKDLRAELGDAYAQALWAAHPHMNRSADLVMYWWDRAAEILTRKGARLRRFGFITTNSISQVFQRRVMEAHLSGKAPLSLVYAVPDHPWTKATEKHAAVRIAMTVAEAGRRDGVLAEVIAESGIDTDDPRIDFARREGRINSDLTVGVDFTAAQPLQANRGLCSRGVQLMGSGFIVTPAEAELLGLGRRPGLERHVRAYRNGKDLTGRARGALVIDLFGRDLDEVRRDFPEIYQHLHDRVLYDLGPDGQPRTDERGRKLGRRWNARQSYRENWWIFGEPRGDFRPAVDGLPRYIATVETAKHRAFQFLDATILPDNRLVCFGLFDASDLAVLSSHVHVAWALANGGTLEDRPIYTKTACFDPFPFPILPPVLQRDLAALGEELDALRKRVLAEHPDLTLTGLYNVLEKLKAGAPLTSADEDVKARGLVLVIKDLHAAIDRLAAEAYGWPADLPEEEILARLVALNAERAREEAAGLVRWLRPDYQAPRFGRGLAGRTGELGLGPTVVAFDRARPLFPKDRYEQPLAVKAVLLAARSGLDAEAVARAFRGPPKGRIARVAAVLDILARYGDAHRLPDGRYVARWAAAG